MAFTFTNAQIGEIVLLMERVGVDGNYASAYRRIVEILSTPFANGTSPLDDPGVVQVYRWFQGAEQANAGEGVFSTKDKAYKHSSVGIAQPGQNARRPLVYLGENKLGGRTISLIQYNKNLYPGIVFTSFSIGCWTPPKKAAWVEFRKDQEWKDYNYEVLHKVVLPELFMERLYQNWERQSRDPDSQELW